jgi:hypothetical protein
MMMFKFHAQVKTERAVAGGGSELGDFIQCDSALLPTIRSLADRSKLE